jgi:hypothetical protein
MTFAKHLLSERLITDEKDGLQKWHKQAGGGQNHYLDAAALARTAMIRRWNTPQPVRRVRRPVLTTPDGRPFVASQR